MPFAYGFGGIVAVPAGPITGTGAPPTSFVGQLGQQFFDTSVSPPREYIFNGLTWESGGNANATTTVAGIVTLTDNNEPVATKFYVDAAIAGVVVGVVGKATTALFGVVELATDAIAVAGTANVPGVTAAVVQPSNLAAVFASPPAIGGTAAAAGAFTTLGFTTMTGTVGGTWASGGTGIQIGQDASNDAIAIGGAGTRAITLGNSTATTNIALNTGTGTSLNLGTNAIAHTVTIGNIIGGTAVNVNTGTGGMLITTTGAGNFAVSAGTNAVIDATGVVELNSSGGVINIGDDAVSQNINLGTAGARTITIGNVTTTTGVAINVGTNGLVVDGVTNSPYTIGASTTTGAITIGGTAQSTGIITLGSSSATSTVKIASGAGASTVTIAEGTAAANTVEIINGNIAAVGTVKILCGTGAAGAAGSILQMANNSRVATIDLGNVAPSAARTTTMLGGNSAQNDTLNILNGAPSAGTQTISILSGTATGGTQALNLGNGIGGSLTVSIGNGANTSAQTINIANGASAANSTVSILSGAGSGGAGTLSLGNNTRVATIDVGNVAPAAARTITIAGGNSAQNDTVTILGGAPSANTQTFNLFSGNASGGTQVCNIGTGTNALAINVGTGGTGVKTIAIGGTAANVITVGNTQTAGSITIGNAMTSGTIQIGGATQTGATAIIIGPSTAAGGATYQIGNATNTGAQVINIASGTTATAASTVNILNGTTPAASTTMNIMCGAASAGTQTFNLLATGATRAGAVNIATGAAAHAVTIGQVTTTIAHNGPTTMTLASGAAVALTVNNAGSSGTAVSITSSGVTVPDVLSNVGGIKVTPTDVSAGASPQTANNRHFKVVFSGVSIAAAADQALVINNSTITGATTDIMYTWFGTTTGSAVSLKSVVNAAGQSTLTFTNGTGATTTTSNITVIGWVMN